MVRIDLMLLVSRHYIAMARQKRPTVPRQVSNYVVDSYVRLRKTSKDEEQQKKSHTYTSSRTLLGILRLAQALARLRFSDVVDHEDVDEALRLMEASKESLEDDTEREREPDQSVVSKIYRLIKDMAAAQRASKVPRAKRRKTRRFGRGPGGERDMDSDEEEENADELSITDIRQRIVVAKGFREDDLTRTLNEVCLLLCIVRR
jgi:DNA replication licensing factor MCM7